ncbi:hypothetical protein G6F57_006464 [Rhizopus arrhizus]|uniref:Uncharacterized protein n=2 Tax=Rhizopus TaxID=4842 RepID=A0A9P6X9K5_RHIOR|nr:hypothetical protein G6F23_007565 [Rhizopus arrhizus]KAG1056825.1 hypothetical protein G6F43_001306 [Rhizopus delemar]KAG0762906.1 hypothetical protein G6F24_006436 [Rhizopus arrhizus]KAG0787431.1 hypothetical protein G6F21_007908 [Rhizopus arrhizus]KAG0799637.1 hypothetical protein G6F22_003030 [Rhizopus arrhizus]
MPGNHTKKQINIEKKESSTYKQPRKNSNVKKETKIVPNKAAGAAILSAVNSPPSPKLVQQSTTVTNTDKFNTNDLVEFLNMRFSGALTSYHDTNLDASLRPEKYESQQEKAWTKPVWGQKPRTHGTMANGLDLINELSHQIK